jgi:hypothetical protein
VLEFSIAENIALHDYAKPPTRSGAGSSRRMIERARTLIREFDVRGGGPLTPRGALSGGNQQKLVAAARSRATRRCSSPPSRRAGSTSARSSTSIAGSSPSADEGSAILLVSLELDEILSLSDRILVMYEGEIVGEHTGEVSEEQIGSRCSAARRARRMSEPGTAPASASSAERARSPRASRQAARRRHRRADRDVVLAFVMGGVVVAATQHSVHNALSPTATSSTAPASTGSSTRRRTCSTSAGVQPLADAAADDDAHPHGLAVAFAFRCGMFNIGGQGQYFVGLIVANWLGVAFAAEPAAAHPPRDRRAARSRRRLGGIAASSRRRSGPTR